MNNKGDTDKACLYVSPTLRGRKISAAAHFFLVKDASFHADQQHSFLSNISNAM